MKPIYLIVLFVLCFLAVSAQKLPATQNINVRAPSTLKKDGRTTEWNDVFKAYNKATQLFYTISNDDAMLYLTAKTTDAGVANKIAAGGISFTIIASGNKKDKNAISITYPENETSHGPTYLRHQDMHELSSDTVEKRKQIDSLVKVLNKKLGDNLKMIRASGVTDIPESLISIYNDTGIKAASLFDSKLHYVVELAVPLKYLGLNIDKPAKFIYQIKLNGTLAANATVTASGSGRFLIVREPGKPDIAIPNIPVYNASAYATDFWGDYTLAK